MEVKQDSGPRGLLWNLKRILRPVLRPPMDVVYRLAHRSEVATIGGVKLLIRHPEVSARMFNLIHRGYYELPERTLLARWFSPSDRILECGAAIGFLALCGMKTVGIRDYAMVEPNPRLRSLRDENLRLNGFVPEEIPAIEAAVAAQDGTVDIVFQSDFWASSSKLAAGESRTVRAMTLHSILATLPFSPNVLVLDIEGSEVDLPLEHFTPFDKLLIETHDNIVGLEKTARLIDALNSAFELKDSMGAVLYFERMRSA